MLNLIISKIKNLIKYAVISSLNDYGDIQTATAKALGKTQKVAVVPPYGLISVPPDGTLVLTYNLQGQESNQAAFAFETKKRIKGFQSGSTGIENYETQDHVLLHPDGSMHINSATGSTIEITAAGGIEIKSINGVLIESPDGLEVTGNVNIDGNLDVTGTITGTPGIDLVTHVHSDPQGGVTGEPQSPPP